MSDEKPLTREQMNRFMEKIKEPFNEAQQQKRRSVEISTGFFEKIAALSAGSTAVLASIILAIANKTDIHTGRAQTVVHDLLRIAFVLGASLICSVLHNFFGTLVARADAAVADSHLLEQIIVKSLPLVQEVTPEVDDATVTQVEEIMRAQMSPKFKGRLRLRTVFYVAATCLGSLSTVAFMAAFVLVIVYLSRLW